MTALSQPAPEPRQDVFERDCSPTLLEILAEIFTGAKPSVVIDHIAFPRIFEAILNAATYSSLLVLRQTGTSVRDQADAAMLRHIRFSYEEQIPGEVAEEVVLSRVGGGGPALPTRWRHIPHLAQAVTIVDTFPMPYPSGLVHRRLPTLPPCHIDLPNVKIVRIYGTNTAIFHYGTYRLDVDTAIVKLDFISPPPRMLNTPIQGFPAEAQAFNQVKTLILNISYLPDDPNVYVQDFKARFSHMQCLQEVVLVFTEADLAPCPSFDGAWNSPLVLVAENLGMLFLMSDQWQHVRVTLVDFHLLPSAWATSPSLSLEHHSRSPTTTCDLVLSELVGNVDSIFRRIWDRQIGWSEYHGVSLNDAVGQCVRFVSSEEWRAEVGDELFHLTRED